MRKVFLLCEYSENENGEIKLKRLEEIDKNEDSAGKRAFELTKADPERRIVQLTLWQIQTSNW